MTTVKLFLFDLDGTLVSTGGAGLRALSKAFKKIYGIDEAHKRLDPSGKTDHAIFREILKSFLERDIEQNEIPAISECYLEHLEIEMKTANTRPLKGVSEFVDHVSKRADIVVGLGTGNLERGARLKLGPTDLNKYFSFGGFGSDAEDRADVLRHGHRRGEKKHGASIPADSVFVIGDTLLDVAAAKRAGFKSVAVATGRSNIEKLGTGSPDFLLNDLTEGHKFL